MIFNYIKSYILFIYSSYLVADLLRILKFIIYNILYYEKNTTKKMHLSHTEGYQK